MMLHYLGWRSVFPSNTFGSIITVSFLIRTRLSLLSTSQRAKIPTASTIRVAENPLSLSNNTKILGVTFDNTLSFDNHISNISKSCFFHIHTLYHIRSAINKDIAKMITCSMVSCHLGYASSFLLGASAKVIQKLE